jgi:hypothetical protein
MKIIVDKSKNVAMLCTQPAAEDRAAQPEKEHHMGTSLARRIRRIGLLSTTYHQVKETVLVKNDKGIEAAQEITKNVPERHRRTITIEELTTERAAMITEWRAMRKKEAS